VSDEKEHDSETDDTSKFHAGYFATNCPAQL